MNRPEEARCNRRVGVPQGLRGATVRLLVLLCLAAGLCGEGAERGTRVFVLEEADPVPVAKAVREAFLGEDPDIAAVPLPEKAAVSVTTVTFLLPKVEAFVADRDRKRLAFEVVFAVVRMSAADAAQWGLATAAAKEAAGTPRDLREFWNVLHNAPPRHWTLSMATLAIRDGGEETATLASEPVPYLVPAGAGRYRRERLDAPPSVFSAGVTPVGEGLRLAYRVSLTEVGGLSELPDAPGIHGGEPRVTTAVLQSAIAMADGRTAVLDTVTDRAGGSDTARIVLVRVTGKPVEEQ